MAMRSAAVPIAEPAQGGLRSPYTAPRITSVHTTEPMTAPTDYLDALAWLAVLQSYMDPSNGTVPYTHARICAQFLNLSDAFSAEYQCMEGHRIDVGEYNVWAMNLL